MSGNGFEFTIEGLDELAKDLEEAINEYPATMQEGLKGIAKEFRSAVRKKTPDGKNHKGDAKTKLRRKFGTKMLYDGYAATALVYNSGRHFHLVENGHELVKNGQNIGFVPGKHMMEKTKSEFQDIVPKRFEQLCDEVLRGHDL
jgi:hypothetical protein